ncbi:transglutaminase-like domain-containing protein [Methanofollis tationis]|uniref:Transglutaminase domain-containing protein n=1 Tax=Methanofollis tationis TaxID=81417 RepID=A0A7K4HLQ2_9EURY|nr:transglutaminase-like domain-containing protein [Methanofollis tationis]NVO66206.1 transglutaminase domain-containing protein [Methanofollis tationis]
MNDHLPALLLIASALLLFTAGCTAAPDEQTGAVTPALSAADEAYARGAAAYAAAYYRTAEEHFAKSHTLSTEAGDAASARQARDAMLRASWTVMEYPLNATAAEGALRESVPGITDDEVSDWLEHRAQRIVSDNETLYFYDVAQNYLYAHPEEMQKHTASTLDFDFVARYVFSEDQPAGEGPYVNPIHYAGTERLEIPRDLLPATGTIRIWYPLPVETESQTNVTVANLSYADAIVKGPVTTGPIGYVYYEIPVETVTGDLTIAADITFTSYEQRFEIDPEQVGEYDTSDPEYLLYTVSERNIEITDAVRAKAREIVGNETNPHLQAEMIYASIIETYPYSHVPHLSLDARVPKVAESTHMFETGHGDCGTQSMLFSAFCRSLGIPARAIGGYQMILADAPGAHFWAQYYLPGYGWVPVDPTVADAADWVPISDEKRSIFKQYYAANLDPTRLVIQKNVDAPLDPPLPDDDAVFRIVRQYPAIVADTADGEINLAGMEGFSITLRAVER